MPTRREYKTLKQRDYRAQARVEGRCVSCLARAAQIPRARCERCLAYNRPGGMTEAQRASWRESHTRAMRASRGRRVGLSWCLECQAYGFHRAGCRAALRAA